MFLLSTGKCILNISKFLPILVAAQRRKGYPNLKELHNRRWPHWLLLILLCCFILISTQHFVHLLDAGNEGQKKDIACMITETSVPLSTGDRIPTPKEKEKQPIESAAKSEPTTQTYVLNTNTKKFHYPNCYSVAQMKDKNRQTYRGTHDDVIAKGYSPCKNCNP